MTSIDQFATAIQAATADLGPSPSPARIVSGEPRCAELVLVDRPGCEIGIWEVSPGRFLSSKSEIGEVMHFVSGAGEIAHADGTVTTIAPGVTLALAAGWEGEWNVTSTVRKVYAIYADKAEGPATQV